MGHQKTAAAVASAGIRIASYFFLQWANLPPLIYIAYTLFAIYVPAFISTYINEPKLALVNVVDVTVKDKLLNEDEATNGDTDEVIVEKNIQVEEEIAIVERSTAPFRTLLSGLPSPNSLFFTTLTFLINAACIAMITDVVYTPRWKYPSHDLSFARIGYVSHTEAKLLIREPDQSKMPVTVQIHVKDAQPPFDNPLWQSAGGVRWTTNETDYTAVVTIPLTHSKQRVYEWTTSNNHSGEFVGAPAPGKLPELNDGKFTFLATSCILPRLPYSPLDHALAIPGMRHLAKVLPTLSAQFMLFLGDFIYIDVPTRFGNSIEDYRQKYRQVYASPDWPAVGQNLSWIHVLDDHEISNDWDAKATGVYHTAVDPWHHYQTQANPPKAKRAGTGNTATSDDATYFSFTQGPASFFMLDTRSYRSKNKEPADSSEKTMLGEQQLADFLDWLRKPEPKGVKWKIVASSVPLTKNWRVNTIDTWGGFLHERRIVLEAMWDTGLMGYGVVVLSGDRHEFGATAFPPPKEGKWPESVTAHEFSASPLNQFYSPIKTYKHTDDEDVELKYINTGNSKFGALTIENLAEGEKSSLKYSLYVDGVETWNTVVVTPEMIPGAKPAGSFWDRIRGVA
ncbi:PhoD-like phosphatase-domain-containing protein [Pseudomassariella vexata]|uniref:PhoD-like phosphatase-domain-containing protein n=1 Tax=Pseudomassariella vexata TaxID=1141098 RepID=A0A1Y2EJ24_9PEZI|nr:PhoD-like phosphatase-domain-containing protein [Pseudomassariella vexata]ORY71578.1 PhoD-like phosphatase-domain-containing protein [Pseudomassariella vexata]